MNKTIIYIIMCTLLVLLVNAAYTPDNYDDVEIILEGSYTPDSYDNIIIVMNPSETNDTCTCPGLNQNWEVDLSDYCVITDNCDLGTGTLSFTETGNFTCDATITTSDMGEPNNNSVIWINDECTINVK